MTKEWFIQKNTCHSRHKPYTKYTTRKDTIVRHITTVVTGLSRNIPDNMLLDHYLTLEYLKRNEQHLYGCGGSHIRIGERMSSPS
jgi:hypothetical protein